MKLSTNLIIIIIVIIIVIGFLLLLWFLNYKEKLQNPQKQPLDFDKNTDIFYINLDRATKRRKNIEIQFKKHGIAGKRYPAIDGRKIDIDDPKYAKHLKYTKSFYKKAKKRIGHFACFLSHLDIMKKCLQKQSPYVAIFEDDAEILVPNFKQKVYKHLENVPDDWDILLLGYDVDGNKDLVSDGNKNAKIKNGILSLNYFTGTHGYIINNKALPILTKELTKHEWVIDWNMAYLAERGKIKIYGVFPPIICQPAMDMVLVKDVVEYYPVCKGNLQGMYEQMNMD